MGKWEPLSERRLVSSAEALRSPLRTAAPTFQSHFQIAVKRPSQSLRHGFGGCFRIAELNPEDESAFSARGMWGAEADFRTAEALPPLLTQVQETEGNRLQAEPSQAEL